MGEQPDARTAATFRCEMCGGEFEKGSDDVADAEALENFGVAKAHANPFMAQVCDDCYQQMNAQIPMKQWTAENPASQAFHRHLDTCRQCHDNPFDLCATGMPLLRAAVDEQDRP